MLPPGKLGLHHCSLRGGAKRWLFVWLHHAAVLQRRHLDESIGSHLILPMPNEAVFVFGVSGGLSTDFVALLLTKGRRRLLAFVTHSLSMPQTQLKLTRTVDRSLLLLHNCETSVHLQYSL